MTLEVKLVLVKEIKMNSKNNNVSNFSEYQGKILVAHWHKMIIHT